MFIYSFIWSFNDFIYSFILFNLFIDLPIYIYIYIESRIGTVSLQVGLCHSFQSCAALISDRPKHAVDSVCLGDVHHEHGTNA